MTFFSVTLILLVAGMYWHARGPWHSYRADLIRPRGTPTAAIGVLRVGVAKVDISPDLRRYDSFVDADQNNKYEPPKGDYFEDKNKNGKVDAVWLAGFGNNRPAKGLHDPLWARAILFPKASGTRKSRMPMGRPIPRNMEKKIPLVRKSPPPFTGRPWKY